MVETNVQMFVFHFDLKRKSFCLRFTYFHQENYQEIIYKLSDHICSLLEQLHADNNMPQCQVSDIRTDPGHLIISLSSLI